MRATDPSATGFVVRPSVSLVIPYVWVSEAAIILLLVTAKYPLDDAPLRLITAGELAVFAVLNAVFLLALFVDGLAIRKYAPCIRRPLLSGVVCGVVNILLMQLLAILAYDPFLGR